MPHLPVATVARTGRWWVDEAWNRPAERDSAIPPEDSEVLRVALEDLELVAALVLALEGDLVAGAADRLAVLVLVGILEADPLTLERPLALGDLAVFQQ